MARGMISGIKRFEIHDGDGIRTTVFLKGCPLNCLWCHNPENICSQPQLMLFGDKCLHCRFCENTCSNHSFREGEHLLNRENCIACGRCAGRCPGGALEVSGETVEPRNLLPRLTEDRMFFETSGGGVTLSGGEPLFQPEFTKEVLMLLKEQGIHTALDTCLFASKAVLEQIHPLVDQFLVDIKAMDPEVHRRCTGVPNEPILENIRYLDSLGKYMEIRIPFIPGHNDSQMEAIAKFLTGLKNRYRIKLLPYHDYGNAKAERLGMKMTEIALPEPEQITAALAWFQQFGLDAVNGAAH